MDQILHLHEFFIEGGNPNKSHVLLNITEPATPEEKAKGYFFAICEINNGNSEYIAKMQEIIDELENNYYEVPDQEDKTSLEMVLDKINTESFSLIKKDSSLHCLVGAIRNNEIIFSFYGEPQMILFYKGKDNEYKKMDLLDDNYEPTPTEGHQLFSQIVQGKIGPNDYVFAGTPHIKDYFNDDRLQKIIPSRPPKQSAEHMQRVLSELRNHLSFGGIIMHMQKPESINGETHTRPVSAGDSDKSLKNLFNTEQSTAQILSPSLLPRLQNKVSQENRSRPTLRPEQKYASAQINSSHLRQHQNVHKATAKKIDGQTVLISIGKFTWLVLQKIFYAFIWILAVLKAFAFGIGKTIAGIFYLLTNFNNKRQSVLVRISQGWNNFKTNIERLPMITKFLLVVSLLLAVVFAGSLEYLSMNRKKENASKAYEEAVQAIIAKKDAADSAVIYNDTAIAFKQIQDAKQLLTSLPCDTEQEKTTCKNLSGQLEAILTKIRRVTVVQPVLLADWSAQSPNVSKIVLVGQKIYGFDANTSTLLSYDILTKESKTITSNLSVSGYSLAAIPKENDYSLFLFGDKDIAEFDPANNSWKKIDIDYPNANAKITSLSVYNRRLYSLDSQNGQVYRHDPIKTGFGRGKEWLKSPDSNLKDTVDMAIDGDLFVLNKNGQISKFSAGVSQPFTVQGLDPVLTSPTEIWTYTDLDFIYILDPDNKRLVIIDKIGQPKAQITADEFVKPTGMAIDGQKSTGYILDSGKLYQISLK